MKENWKPIKNFETKYLISNYGNVKSLKTNTILKPYTNKTKYLYVCLSNGKIKKHYRIHRLVANAFIPNPKLKKFINHKDYDTFNNKVENLEWVTMKENIEYSRENVLLGIRKRIALYGK